MADCIVIERSHTQKSHQHIEPRVLTGTQRRRSGSSSSSSSRSSDGNSGLLDEGGSASQVPQATVKLLGYESVVWPDSLSEWLVDGAGLQQMFYCLTASTARALLCMADVEFRIQVMAEVVVACPEPEHCHLFPSG